MGCCGCDNKASALTAGIFGLIQSIVGLILNAYFVTLYSSYSYPFDQGNLDDRIFLLYATYDAHTCIFVLLVTATILHGIWFLSSITLMIGNANNNACCVRQWVVCTSFVIIGDVIMPTILIASTIETFVDVFIRMSGGIYIPGREHDQLRGPYVYWSTFQDCIYLMRYYIILLMSFIKLGPITFITNVCLNVFTDRRASDIYKRHVQTAGTAMTVIQGYPVYPGMMNMMAPDMVLTHPAFAINSGIPQSGPTHSSYSQNIPGNAAVNASSLLSARGGNCRASHGSQTVFNDLTESLTPPILNNDDQHNLLPDVTRETQTATPDSELNINRINSRFGP